MSPRTSEQLAEIKDQRREQILDVALVVFARQGFEATKVSDLATAASMSQGLLYRYFPSKEAVYCALLERAMVGARNLVEQALARPDSAWDRLHWLCEAMLEGVRERPEYVALLSRASSTSAPEQAQETLARNGSATFKSLVRLLAEGQAVGQIAPDDPAELVRAFTALIQGLALGQTQSQRNIQHIPRTEVVMRLFRA